MIVGLSGEEGKEDRKTNTLDENRMQLHETVSLKFPQAKDCLAEFEDDLFSFGNFRPQENTTTHLYDNNTYNVITKSRFLSLYTPCIDITLNLI